MRLWLDPNGAVVNDGRLLSHISSYGSLSEAAKEEDFRLLSDTGSDRRKATPAPGLRHGPGIGRGGIRPPTAGPRRRPPGA